MKLSLSVLLLVVALVNVQAASSNKSSGSNIICTRPNNRGSGSGLGWRGFCCKTDDDCHESCIKGKCNGRVDPKYASPIGDGTCVNTGNIGSRTGEGWKDYCCESSDDCRDSCIKGKCTGKPNPKYA